MNRRNFLSNLAKSFFILPGAGRVWKAVAKEPHYITWQDIHKVREYVRRWSIPSPLENFLRWQHVISQTGWPANLSDVTRTTEEIMREHCAKHNILIPSRLGPSTGIAVAYNPPIIRPL